MSQSNRPDEVELAQAYFYSLIRNPLAPPPPGLDLPTAGLIRQLVLAEQRATRAAQPQLEPAQQRVWKRLLDQSETKTALRNGIRGAEVQSLAGSQDQEFFGLGPQESR